MSYNDSPLSLAELFVQVGQGWMKTHDLLTKWCLSSPDAIEEIRILHAKGWSGLEVWELFLACGQNLERFRYHVTTELPDRDTGKLTLVSGKYAPEPGDREFWRKRAYGRPGSYWALKNPPIKVDYEYPIT